MTSSMTSASTSEEGAKERLAVVIGVSVAGAALLIAAVSLLVVLGCRVCRRRQTDDHHVTCTDVIQHTGPLIVCVCVCVCVSVCLSV